MGIASVLIVAVVVNIFTPAQLLSTDISSVKKDGNTYGTVTTNNANNIEISSPSLRSYPRIYKSGRYSVIDKNGQDFAEPNGKRIRSASGGIYGFLVTNADGSVFTATEFIGGHPTTKSNRDPRSLSNDSSNSATESTAGLVTDDAVQFPTESFGDSTENTGINTIFSTITEISINEK